MKVESSYLWFFETYDNIEDNRQQQKLLLKPKYIENCDNETKRLFEAY